MNIKKTFRKIKHTLFADKRIALIKLEGVIVDSNVLPIATKIIEALEDAKKMGFKAVVLRINSPGGTVGASQEIYSAIKRIQKDNIKVVVSIGDVAASGGVYVGVAGDKIVANPGSVTGSIGVIIKSSVLKKLYGKLGVDSQVVKSGEFKDILSNTRYFSKKEKVILQELIDSTYEQFLNTVAIERGLEVEAVRKFADGRIFSGEQAQKLGLVDKLGSQKDAVDLAAKLVGIKEEPKLINISPKKGFLQKISKLSIEQILENLGAGSVHSGVPLWIMPGI